MEAIVNPIFISAAETDAVFTTEKRHLTEKILKKNKNTYFISLCSGVEHGFGSKADPKDVQANYAMEKCAKDFIQWFDYIHESMI